MKVNTKSIQIYMILKINLKNKDQISIFLFYSVSNALNKGISILALPILSVYLSISDFGLWSLSNISIVVLAPIISFNGYASILREGVGEKRLAWNILKKYLVISSIMSICIGAVAIFNLQNWIFITLLLACVEAFQVLLLGWYRSQDNHLSYMLVSLIKIFSIILSVFILDNINVVSVLQLQLVISSIMLLFFYFFLLIKNKKILKEDLDFKKIISFSLLLIPHNLSLWILSSSDRFIIKSLIGEYELGIYSVCYSIGLIIMLLNTGVALVLPNYIIKNYKVYIIGSIRRKLIFYYSTCVITLSVVIFFSISYFKDYFEFLKAINTGSINIILWIINGLYLLGLYYFYSNILFYKRRAKYISISTLFGALLNIFLTIFLIPIYGTVGAAIATFISYFIYLFFIFYFAQKTEKSLNNDLIFLISVILVTLFLNFTFFKVSIS